MGLFGGDSSSSKTEINKSQSQGFSEISGPVNAINAEGESSVNFTVTDRGAVNRSISSIQSVANKASDNALKSQSNALGFGRDALSFGSTSLTKVLDFARTASQQSQEVVQQTNRDFTQKFSEFANRQTSTSDQKVVDTTKWIVGGVVAWGAFQAWNRSKRA